MMSILIEWYRMIKPRICFGGSCARLLQLQLLVALQALSIHFLGLLHLRQHLFLRQRSVLHHRPLAVLLRLLRQFGSLLGRLALQLRGGAQRFLLVDRRFVWAFEHIQLGRLFGRLLFFEFLVVQLFIFVIVFVIGFAARFLFRLSEIDRERETGARLV